MKLKWNKYLLALVICVMVVGCFACQKAPVDDKKEDDQAGVEDKDLEDDEKEQEPLPDPEPEPEVELDPYPEVTAALAENTLGVNLVRNGDFSNGKDRFSMLAMKGGRASVDADDGAAVIEIDSTGFAEYANQFIHDGFALRTGGVYEFSFDISSTLDRMVEARIQLNGGDYRAYIGMNVAVTADVQTFTGTFEMVEDDIAPRLCFNIGREIDGMSLDPHVITIDNISLKLTNSDNIVMPEEDEGTVACNLNQVGYLPDANKVVTVRAKDGEATQTEFTILNDKEEVVYTGKLSAPVYSENADESVYIGDFTEFKTDGTYTIKVGDNKVSFPFKIGADVYDEMLMDAFRMLYLQRCGCNLTKEYAGAFSHNACHTEDARIYGTNDTKDLSGGWHDAGDYGRYVAPGVVAAYDLLLLYEDYPEFWGTRDDLEIPESGNGVPDVLDEARYEIDWLLKMQDVATGGVYHKVTTKEFPGTIMPQDDKEVLYASPISSTATADFAAIMAKSSTVYREYDAEFADNCLAAAIKAWDYLDAAGYKGGFRNPAGIVTGEYPDGQDEDERFWASIELYKVTNEQKYLDYAHESMKRSILLGYGWAAMGGYGNMAYESLDASVRNDELYGRMKTAYIQKANTLVGNADKDGYQNCLGNDYVWGSNMVVCNNAREMLFANELTGDAKYLDYAEDQLHYLLGRNTVSYCFLTEYGSQSAKHSHHRPSTALGVVQKGMLIGGPNKGLEDPFSKNVLAGLPPAKCYIDNEQSYSVNEITIYWNTPFIHLLSSQML